MAVYLAPSISKALFLDSFSRGQEWTILFVTRELLLIHPRTLLQSNHQFCLIPTDMNPNTKDVYLVVGGSGLLGRHIAERLRDRGDTVAVLDIVQRYDDIPFYNANICEEEAILDVLKRVCYYNLLTIPS